MKVNLLLKHRLGRFRDGAISSEDFEKATGPERMLDRVNRQIADIEKRLWGRERNMTGSGRKQRAFPKSGLRGVFTA